MLWYAICCDFQWYLIYNCLLATLLYVKYVVCCLCFVRCSISRRCGGRYDPQLVKRSSEWVSEYISPVERQISVKFCKLTAQFSHFTSVSAIYLYAHWRRSRTQKDVEGRKFYLPEIHSAQFYLQTGKSSIRC